MDIEKVFLTPWKNIWGNFFQLKFWDGEERKEEPDSPKIRKRLKAPLKKKDSLTSNSLTFGEAYMNGD